LTTKRKDEITCIQLSKQTRDKLANLGTKTDTFESIILKQLEKPCAVKPEVEENEL
jgi:hypothetical protein